MLFSFDSHVKPLISHYLVSRIFLMYSISFVSLFCFYLISFVFIFCYYISCFFLYYLCFFDFIFYWQVDGPTEVQTLLCAVFVLEMLLHGTSPATDRQPFQGTLPSPNRSWIGPSNPVTLKRVQNIYIWMKKRR